MTYTFENGKKYVDPKDDRINSLEAQVKALKDAEMEIRKRWCDDVDEIKLKAEQAEKLASGRLEQIKILGKVKHDEIKDLTAQLEDANKEIERLGSLRVMREVTEENARFRKALEEIATEYVYKGNQTKPTVGSEIARKALQQLSNQGDGDA